MTVSGSIVGTMAGLPRRAARLFFRHHIENGLAVSLCLAAVAIVAGLIWGIQAAVLAAIGAMCVSIVDQPGPIPTKLRMFAAALCGSSLISLLAGLAAHTAWAMAGVVALTSLAMALATAFGRPALTLAISGVLALIIGMAIPTPSAAVALHQSLLFFCGGLAYAVLGMIAALVLDDRNRRMVLNEALLAFAAYLRARARLYDGAVAPEAALAGVIEAHGTLMERLQAARDTIFSGRIVHGRRRWLAGMVAFLDLYEAVLSSDADWVALRRGASAETSRLIASATRTIAEDVDAIALAIVSPATAMPIRNHDALIANLDAAIARGADGRVNLQPTREKLARALRRTRLLATRIVEDGEKAVLPAVDLSAFVQPRNPFFATLRAHLTATSPVMRYAIRLTLAMLAGYIMTIAFPAYVHGGWILLTVALIMRASYAVTAQRRNDRILGTLAGCAVAAVLIPILPEYAVIAGVIVGVGAAHAFATVNYRVTSFTASVMALLLLHFLEPHNFYIFDRIVDTLIGAGLSIIFARVLPSWEWRDVPRLIQNLLAADRSFASDALALASRDDLAYRLARKKALDSFTALAMTTRRLSSEPRMRAHQFAHLNDLLAANYLFASDLASVQGLLRARAKEIDAAAAETLLSNARARVQESLAPRPTPPPPGTLRRRGWNEMSDTDPMMILRRRLLHIEHSAQRLGARAALASGD